jgi:YggT family protein
MSTIAEITRYLVQTALGVLLFAVLIRLLLQLARADFYNPLSQFVVKVTSPLLRPLRRVIPAVGRLDTASVVLALAIQCVSTVVALALLGVPLRNPLLLLAWSAIGILSLLVNIYFFGILLLIIFSWIAPQSHHPALALLYQLTEPVMAPVRRLLPPIGGLDLSPILVFVIINVLEILLRGLAQGLGLPPGLVLGF